MTKKLATAAAPAATPVIQTDFPPARRGRVFPGITLSTTGGANPADAPGLEINSIVAQFRKHGTLPKVTLQNPLFGDFTFPEDIHSVREAVLGAEDRFMDLPADVRTAADNDWVQFYGMVADPEKLQILKDAGLQIVEQLSTKDDCPADDEKPAATPDTGADA